MVIYESPTALRLLGLLQRSHWKWKVEPQKPIPISKWRPMLARGEYEVVQFRDTHFIRVRLIGTR
jgi:hypothetical protein